LRSAVELVEEILQDAIDLDRQRDVDRLRVAS
jgi:hypothetical protein